MHDLQELAAEINKKIMQGITKEQTKMLDGILNTMKYNLQYMDGDAE